MEDERQRQREELGVACLECRDTGRVEAGYWDTDGICSCAAGEPLRQEKKAREVAAWRAGIDAAIGIPRRYANCTIGSFPDQESPALLVASRWSRNTAKPGDDWPQGRGLYLSGMFGRGKTGIAVAALRAYVIRRGVRDDHQKASSTYAQFIPATALLEGLRPDEDDEHAPTRNLRRLRTIPALAIDDFGAERLTEWGVDRLFEVINHRHNELLPTLITSNFAPDDLAAKINRQVGGQYGDRIVERIVESCEIVAFPEGARNWRMEPAA